MSGWSKKRGIVRRYDITAEIYDTRYAEEQAAKIEAALKDTKLKKHSLALDAGCGTGLLFDYVACEAEAVVGLDISRKLLSQAEKRAKKYANVHLILADADNMPFKERIFDYVFAFTLIQNMPNPARTFNEIVRVAKEDAVIVVTALKKAFTLERFERLLQDANLHVVSLRNESLKCYVAVCTKFLH